MGFLLQIKNDIESIFNKLLGTNIGDAFSMCKILEIVFIIFILPIKLRGRVSQICSRIAFGSFWVPNEIGYI